MNKKTHLKTELKNIFLVPPCPPTDLSSSSPPTSAVRLRVLLLCLQARHWIMMIIILMITRMMSAFFSCVSRQAITSLFKDCIKY